MEVRARHHRQVACSLRRENAIMRNEEMDSGEWNLDHLPQWSVPHQSGHLTMSAVSARDVPFPWF